MCGTRFRARKKPTTEVCVLLFFVRSWVVELKGTSYCRVCMFICKRRNEMSIVCVAAYFREGEFVTAKCISEIRVE